MTQGRKNIINLPLKIILTQEGSSFFLKRNKKLLRFRLANTIEEYGIAIEKFNPASIQSLMLTGYISKIEVSKPEFVSSRQEIMDICKLIVYSVLYRQYDNYIFQQVLESDLIKQWNRRNPLNIIDAKTRIREQYLRSILSQVDDVRREILEPLQGFITANTALLPEEKNIQLLLSEKFLMNMRPFIWFIVVKFQNSSGFDQILKIIRSTLTEYMDKARIAEYISLMLMELIVNAENTNIKKEAKLMFKEDVDMNNILLDPEVRQSIVAELAKKHDLLYLSWKLGGVSSAAIGTQGKLQITLYNKEEHSEAVRESILDKTNANVREKSIVDFYSESPEDSESVGMGLYYLSYLNEACSKVNVRFESYVNQFSSSDLTVINLSFVF